MIPGPQPSDYVIYLLTYFIAIFIYLLNANWHTEFYFILFLFDRQDIITNVAAIVTTLLSHSPLQAHSSSITQYNIVIITISQISQL